ncbi:MAG: YgiT-type zinc finger protein [Planctomycetes bacterium]|nr:YgiT-type zinc finger protein [Planctomycetota bacterium]
MKFQCLRCGRGTVRSTYVTETFLIQEQTVLVKGIPVGLCPRCGERYFQPRVRERVRRLAEDAPGPIVLYTNEYAPPGGGTIQPTKQQTC